MVANWSDISPDQLLRAHTEARTRNTGRAYASDMGTFVEFLRSTGVAAPSPAAAVEWIVSLPRGSAKLTVNSYLGWLRHRYPALNTIRRKVQSVRGLLSLAHECGVIPWSFKMAIPVPTPIRDTRGPGRKQVDAMVEACNARGDDKGIRDKAIISLMAFAALRVGEVLTLDVRHVDVPSREVEILSKGLWGRVRHPIPQVTAEAVIDWLAARGEGDGPLFTTLGRGHDTGKRLGYWGCYDLVKTLGRKAADTDVHPHGLRHFAATEHLRLTNGNVPFAMALTRHKDPRTLMVYNDDRMIRAREAMEIIAAGIPCYRQNGANTQDNYSYL